MFVRNIKKGYATNSSSYHSTIMGYIDLPEDIWIKFKDDNASGESKSYGRGKVQLGMILEDDEGRVIKSYDEIKYDIDEIQILSEKDGVRLLRIVLEYKKENY